MCGISGLFGKNVLTNNIGAEQKLKSMVGLHASRGPDDYGLFLGKSVALGHSRLSILDVIGSKQPMMSLDRRYVIVYNGELFNYVELKAELASEGIKFHSDGDTEVVLNSFIHWREKSLEKFNGQFAFSIYDRKSGELFLARDRFGIRPLFFSFHENLFIFSSTIKSILSTGVPSEINLNGLNQSTYLWTTLGSTSFVKNIHALEPGYFMAVDRNLNYSVSQYWDLNFEKKDISWTKSKAIDAVRSGLEMSVKLQSRADVAVNTYLSGGVDSCILQSILCSQVGTDFSSYSVRFEDSYFDESYQQEMLSSLTGVRNRSVSVSAELISQHFETAIWHCEQPLFRTAPVPMMLLSASVLLGNDKVVMSGEGADEIAWGYPIFKENFLREQMLRGEANVNWGDAVVKLNNQLPQYNHRFQKFLVDFYRTSLTDEKDPLFTHEVRIRNGSAFEKYVEDGILSRDRISTDVSQILPECFMDWSVLQRTQYIEMKTLLANYLLSSQGDRMSMANSVEARVPFLDNDMVDLFASFPDNLKLANGVDDKFILREAFKDILPPQLSNRPKYPYRAPEAAAMILPPVLSEYLNEAVVKNSGIFKWSVVERLVGKVRRGVESWNFTDNNALVMITSTLIFQRLLSEKNWEIDVRKIDFRIVNEGDLDEQYS
ncbi:MAG: asparagine synthase (glutamine-hydrolyzing) [Pseudomonadota bacterium]|nr:asparagine synthase (glutamine-hydrolyzing) [Pseudomonadota bacterium]